MNKSLVRARDDFENIVGDLLTNEIADVDVLLWTLAVDVYERDSLPWYSSFRDAASPLAEHRSSIEAIWSSYMPLTKEAVSESDDGPPIGCTPWRF